MNFKIKIRHIYWVINRDRSDQIRLVTQSCPTLCDPTNRSMPGLPVHHQLPEFTQTHVHRVSDAIQPSHPLSSPSPPAHCQLLSAQGRPAGKGLCQAPLESQQDQRPLRRFGPDNPGKINASSRPGDSEKWALEVETVIKGASKTTPGREMPKRDSQTERGT